MLELIFRPIAEILFGLVQEGVRKRRAGRRGFASYPATLRVADGPWTRGKVLIGASVLRFEGNRRSSSHCAVVPLDHVTLNGERGPRPGERLKVAWTAHILELSGERVAVELAVVAPGALVALRSRLDPLRYSR